MTAPTDARPRPIHEAFKSVGGAVAFLGSLVASLAGWGIITATQGDAITGLLGLVPGAVTAVSVLLAAFGVVRRAEPEVTPMIDPRDDDGTPFVRLHAAA
jgi:hypothetical protein